VQKPRLIAYVVAWLVLVVTLVIGASGVDGDDHERAMSGFLDLREKQTELDELLHDARSSSGARPQRIVPAFVRLESAVASLPAHVDLDRHADVGSALSDYMDVLRASRGHVERYAALAALLQDEVRAEASAERIDAATRGDWDRARRSDYLNQDLDVERAAIEAAELSRSCDALVAEYGRSFSDRLDDAGVYRLCLYLITGLLLVRLVQSMRELQQRTAELRTANRTLEARVEERTRTLSDTNRALETAIAEARGAERDARSAREAAESANRTKSSFLANMSHEIRTPMTSILGFSERLLEEDLSDADRADAVATIRRNGEHLSQLVSDILDLSKIEAGKLALEFVACSPYGIVADMREAMAPRAQGKGLEFLIEWAGPAPESIRTDPLRVEQVLFNLVGNAIKFTDRGRILVRVGYEEPAVEGRNGKLGFDIEDTGVGMDERTMTRLFRPFVQGDSSTTRRFGGTGLGLSICSHLVAGLGGAIHVSSQPGRGSVFSFHVDAGPLTGPLVGEDSLVPASAHVKRFPATSLDGMRLLLAEDGEDNQRLLRHLLTSAGANVSLAIDGEEAVHLALAAHAHGRPFDAVLMDMQMPRLDGYEATRRLRAAGYERPIVALTANAMAPDRERCLAAGCDDYCAKPVRRAVLLEKVGRWRRAGTKEEPTMATRSDRTVEADHDAGLVELVRSFVEDLGRDMGAMRAALASEDHEELSMLAHRLKGAAGSYGFPEITRQAALLESAVRDGVATDAVACELASLEAICAAARRS